MENDSDEELVLQVLQGDAQSYGRLVERYERPVFNLLFRFCRSELEAADLSQEVFLCVYERLASFDHRRKFFPWLYTLAMNKGRDWQRGNSRQRRKLNELQWDKPAIDTGSEQEHQLLVQEEIDGLYGALDTLVDETRELVLLRYQQELSIRDLSEIFGLSESAVKMRIARALERMKSVLGGERDAG